MSPHLILLFVMTASPSPIASMVPEQRPPLRLSLEGAIAQAIETSESVSIATAGVDRADANLRRAWSEWLPQISGSLTYDRTLQTEYEGLFSSPETGGLFDRLPFGQPNTWRAGLAFSQNLFAGGRSLARLSAAEDARQTAAWSRVSAKAQAVLVVVQAYYDALLAQRAVEIEEESLRQAERTLEQARAALANDTKPAFDVLRAEVALGTVRPKLVQRQGEAARTQRSLRQALDLSPAVPLLLISRLEDPLVDPVKPAVASIGFIESEPRISVRQARSDVAQRVGSFQIAAAQRLPQLDASMSYGFSAYPEKFVPGFDDMRENWIVGLALRVPLFSGMRVTADVDAARADMQEARARLRQAEELSALDADNAARDLETALAAYQANTGVVEQAEASVRIAELRYSEGVSTQLELADAQLLLTQARVNQAQAIRDLQVARIRRALLPVLPVLPASTAGLGVPTLAAGAGGTTSSSFLAAGSGGLPGLAATGGTPAAGAPALIPGASSSASSASSPTQGFSRGP